MVLFPLSDRGNRFESVQMNRSKREREKKVTRRWITNSNLSRTKMTLGHAPFYAYKDHSGSDIRHIIILRKKNPQAHYRRNCDRRKKSCYSCLTLSYSDGAKVTFPLQCRGHAHILHSIWLILSISMNESEGIFASKVTVRIWQCAIFLAVLGSQLHSRSYCERSFEHAGRVSLVTTLA